MSCNFVASGNTVNTCFNTCQNNNVGDCATYCNNICDSCTNSEKCKWLSSQKDIDNIKSQYNKLTSDLKLYQQKESSLYKGSDEKLNIDLLNKISDIKTKRSIIWSYLVNTYNLNTMLSSANNSALIKNDMLFKSQTAVRDNMQKKIKDMNNKTSTEVDQIKTNEYKYKKTLEELEMMKLILKVLLISLILPLSSIPEWSPMTKEFASVLYALIVFGLFIYAFYNLVVKNSNRDNIRFSEKNFNKPSKKEIMKSKMAEMGEGGDNAGLDFDPDSIDIGNVNKYINEEPKCNAKNNKQ